MQTQTCVLSLDNVIIQNSQTLPYSIGMDVDLRVADRQQSVTNIHTISMQ